MPEAKFLLKEPKAKDETLVYLFYNFNYQRLKYSTGEKILPKFWNEKKQRAKESSQFSEHSEFNQRLTNIKQAVSDCYRRLQNDGIKPTPDILRDALNIALNKENKIKPQTFFQFVEKFIEQIKPTRKPGSIQVYEATLKHLKDFSSEKRRKVDFDSINLDFYHDFSEYLSKDLAFVKNTQGKYIKNLKMFLNEATERGINKNMDYKSKKFKVLREDIDHEYFTSKELEHLYKLDLSKKPALERVRDLFLVGCHTGLRFSDFTQLTKGNLLLLSDGKYFEIETQKTGEKVRIPIKPTVWKIWKKYKDELPRAISNQKMNDYLKDIAEEAKFTTAVVIKRTQGSETKSTEFRRCDLISTHTARRSFATNAFKEGVPPIRIMKLTGHRNEKSFLRYIKISQEENASSLVRHSFFTEAKPKLKIV